jgi:hypothetical protein
MQNALKEYVAYCPSCGNKVEFIRSTNYIDNYCMEGTCTNEKCKKKWSYIFEIDKSGTFGVMSFQCNNEDRE